MGSDKQPQNSEPQPTPRRGAGRPWKPGESGNPNGRPRLEDSLGTQLREVLAEVHEDSGKTKARLLAEKYVALGLDGNVMAITAIMDRMEGKPAQSVTLKGDSETPLHVRHSERLPMPGPAGSPAASANGSPAPGASEGQGASAGQS